MKIQISDLMNDCCPQDVVLGQEDKEMTRRINAAVIKKLGTAKPRRRGNKIVRTLLLVAAIAALMGTAAYAANAWRMKTEPVDEPVSGRWYVVDEDGKVGRRSGPTSRSFAAGICRARPTSAIPTPRAGRPTSPTRGVGRTCLTSSAPAR